jgi:aromatic-L-amino-acid decarboxylase
MKKTERRPFARLPGQEPNRTSLDPSDWTDFREQAHRMLDDMLGSIEKIRESPVWQTIPEEVRAGFRQAIPACPTSLAEVHREFMTSILPYTARNTHPGFMGWVQGGGTSVGMLAEMLAAGLNANVGGRDQIPLEVERQVTDWVRKLFGFPPGASGLFVTGTSMANLLAVVVARDSMPGLDVRSQGVSQGTQKLTAYASSEVHGCIARALDVAGLGSAALRIVAVDSRNRIDLGALSAMIAADRIAGLTPFLVVGTAGTVNTGAIDDLDGIAEVCIRERLWFHVDGACGALAILAAELAPRFRGIEKSDSLAFDFHKWGQVPYDAGFLLVRDGALHQQAFASPSSYLAREGGGMSAGSPWPCDLGVDLSRSFRALKTWITLKVYGTNAIGAVISRTCELARYLQSRILESAELEMTASVELNIVCFRYRFGTEACTETDEASDRINRDIVVALHEGGSVAPSTTVIGGRLSIRAAIVNHRTSRTEIDTLINATLEEGRKRRNEASSAVGDQGKWQPWLERDAKLRELTAELKATPLIEKDTEVALRMARAGLLVEMARNLEARADYLRALELAPTHLLTLTGLGRLLVAEGNHRAAQLVYSEAVKSYPDDLVCLVNLGSVLLEGDAPARARLHYEAALRIDPEFPQAHGGMYYALTRLGETEAAKMHQRKSFGKKSLFSIPYKGDSPPVPVLLLVSSTGGITPIEKLLDDRIFQTYVVVADFYDTKIPLPEHCLVFNGIGDPDIATEALLAAVTLLASTSMPILNPPSAVLHTGRCDNARRLEGVAGLITPATAVFSSLVLAGPDGTAALARSGLTFPILLRAPGFHMGQHFVRVEGTEGLAPAVTSFPGGGRPETEVLAIEYLDASRLNGCTRKYRVMTVGRRLYPLHLAISKHWKIHYFSADMADRPEHRAEEAMFLADMEGTLGSKVIATLERVQAALGLDYGGIDFSINKDGAVLLFEANATMVVEQPGPDPRWDYRRTAVERIHLAVRHLLLSAAGTIQTSAEKIGLDAASISQASCRSLVAPAPFLA